MTDKKLYDMLNDRMVKELQSAYFYFDLHTQCINLHFHGYATLFKKIVDKHIDNAYGYRDQIILLSGLPLSKQIEQGREKKFSTILEIVKASVRREKELSRELNEIIWYAKDNKHWSTSDMLVHKYTEQLHLQQFCEDIESQTERAHDLNWIDNNISNLKL